MGYMACRGPQANGLKPCYNYSQVFNHQEESKHRNVLTAILCYSHSKQLCPQRQICLAYISLRAGDPKQMSLRRLAMEKASLKPPPQHNLGHLGRCCWEPQAGKRGPSFPSSSRITSAALASTIQGLSPWIHTHLSTSAQGERLLCPSCWG